MDLPGPIATTPIAPQLEANLSTASHTIEGPDLPNELWMCVIGKVLEWDTIQLILDTLRNLTLVSHRFSLMAQPVLFQHTGLNFLVEARAVTEDVISHFEVLLEFLMARPDIALRILKSHFHAPSQGLSYAVADCYGKLLEHLPNIRVLEIDGLKLTDGLLKGIQRATALRVCRFNNPGDFSKRPIDPSVTNIAEHFLHLPPNEVSDEKSEIVLQNAQVEELEGLFGPLGRITGRVPNVMLDLFRSPKLKRVRIVGDTESRFIWNSLPSTVTTPYRLTAIHMNLPQQADFPKFVAVLESCPDLVDLRLKPAFEMLGSLGYQFEGVIPATAAPKLRKLVGTVALARLLAPGRPILYLGLHRSRTEAELTITPEGLELIRGGTRELQVLEISRERWIDGYIENIAQVFPTLRRLIVANFEGEHLIWLASHGVDVLTRFPNLVELKMLGVAQTHLDPEWEKKILEAMALPNLVEATFRYGNVWKKGPSGWELHVKPATGHGIQFIQLITSDVADLEPFDDD